MSDDSSDLALLRRFGVGPSAGRHLFRQDGLIARTVVAARGQTQRFRFLGAAPVTAAPVGVPNRDREPLLPDVEDGGRSVAVGKNPVPVPSGSERRHKTFLGHDMIDDAEGWHYIMVFNRPADASERARDAQNILRDCFMQRALEEWAQDEPEFHDKVQSHDGVTRAELFEAVWQRLLKIFSGEACGFAVGFKPSFDEQQVLLFLKLENPDTTHNLANRLGIKVRATSDAYKVKGLRCPRVGLTVGQRFGCNKSVAAEAPVYLKFESSRQAAFNREAQTNVERAGEQIDDLLRIWRADESKAKGKIRRIVRLDDMKCAYMVVLVDRIHTAERQEDQTSLAELQELFAAFCHAEEQMDEALRGEVAGLDDKALLQRRLQRWGEEEYLSLEGFKSARLYEELNHLDKLRLMKRRIAQFIDDGALIRHGVISMWFPPHHVSGVAELTSEWASLWPRHIFQWPHSCHSDMVRNYFGEEVAFFFDWLSYHTRSLIIPSALGIVSTLARAYSDSEEHKSIINLMFCIGMVVWVALATSSYNQAITSKNIQWGMMGWSDRAMVRSSFRPEMRGSVREYLIRGFHAFLVMVFIAETIYSAGKIAHFRRHALQHPDERTVLLGIEVSNEVAAKVGLLAVSANVKIVDALWTVLSPLVSARENWRTDLELKNSQVTKTFLVKCVVYYYPFYYLAFVRDFVEGCRGSVCWDELKINLMVFIGVHITTVILLVLFQIAMTSWTEHRSYRTAQSKAGDASVDVVYTYVQAQTQRPQYSGDADDYMELAIMMGFISMFSVIYPVCAFLAFVSNLFELRILAFRMCYVERRPVPRGQDGIGAWLLVMQFVTYLSCATAVGLIVFRLKPMSRWSHTHQLAAFIVAEHAMLVAVFMITRCVPDKSVTDKCILEVNEIAHERLTGGDAKPVEAVETDPVCLKSGADHITPGKPLELK